jgi:hypothetical protein
MLYVSTGGSSLVYGSGQRVLIRASCYHVDLREGSRQQWRVSNKLGRVMCIDYFKMS